MLDSIFVGLTGLLGYSKNLKVISNNVANLSTPGFKSSELQFADLFYSAQGGGSQTADGGAHFGQGVNTLSTVFDFKQGDIRQTGNDLDAAIDGNGLFVLKTQQGDLHFSRAGQFTVDGDGFLVSRGGGERVLALTEDGELADISITGLRLNPPRATATVKFSGNLSSTVATDTVNGVTVIDAIGGEHVLKLVFGNNSSVTTGEWTVTVSDQSGSIGTGTIRFTDGKPDPAASSFTLTYAPAGTTGAPVTFDFSTDTTSFASGTQSTLASSSQDGAPIGSLTKVGFDADGHLVATYSNGEVVNGVRLALADFDTPDTSLTEVGGNEYAAKDTLSLHLGFAGANGFGKINGGFVEVSNVDLSQEFSDLIVTQRGYQASSQVISAANELLQELLDMRSKR